MKIDAGWYLDPTGAHHKRYWDGSRWTEFVQDADGTERRAPLASGDDVVRVSMTSSASAASSETSTSPASAFSAAVTGSTTLSADGDTTQRDRWSASADAADPALPADPSAGADTSSDATDQHGATAARVGDARALRTAAIWLSFAAVVLAVVPIFAPVGLMLAIIALVIGLVARRRIIAAAEVDQRGSALAVLLAILASLACAISSALFAVSFMLGDVARLITCLASDGAAMSCLNDYFAGTWSRLG